jgi:hypothetical protein
MTTLYAYWDSTTNELASAYTISETRKGSGERLMYLLGEQVATALVTEGTLFITEIKVERVINYV